jgi:hypothetical protein
MAAMSPERRREANDAVSQATRALSELMPIVLPSK